MTSSIFSRLGIRFPIIQAPMAGVSTLKLAAAVCEAGGLGSIALGTSTAEQARKQIGEMRALTGKPFNANVFCHRPAQADPAREAQWLAYLAPHFDKLGATAPTSLKEIYKSFVDDEAMLEVFVSERPAVVSFHFGLPSQRYIDALKAAGIVLMACVTTPAEARLAEQAGVDILVAQGIEAGGHRGVFDPGKGDAGIGTFALVRLLATSSRLPIVAAGGIMDGQGIAAALALGASAVQLGTAFVLCPESSANAHYRGLFSNEQVQRTELTAAISGRSARGFINRFVSDIGASGHPPIPDYPIAYDAAKALNAAATQKGVTDYAVAWAGQGAALARQLPAGELVKVLAEELAAARS